MDDGVGAIDGAERNLHAVNRSTSEHTAQKRSSISPSRGPGAACSSRTRRPCGRAAIPCDPLDEFRREIMVLADPSHVPGPPSTHTGATRPQHRLVGSSFSRRFQGHTPPSSAPVRRRAPNARRRYSTSDLAAPRTRCPIGAQPLGFEESSRPSPSWMQASAARCERHPNEPVAIGVVLHRPA